MSPGPARPRPLSLHSARPHPVTPRPARARRPWPRPRLGRALPPGDARGDGYAAAEFVVGVAFIIVPVTLLVLSLPLWLERQAMAQRAASESARQMVLAPDWSTGLTQGHQVIDEIARNYNLPAGDLSEQFSGNLARGQTIRVEVTVKMPALAIPLIGRVGTWEWTAVHVEHVDNYRSF
jgi:hypothetical protein